MCVAAKFTCEHRFAFAKTHFGSRKYLQLQLSNYDSNRQRYEKERFVTVTATDSTIAYRNRFAVQVKR